MKSNDFCEISIAQHPLQMLGGAGSAGGNSAIGYAFKALATPIV